MVKLMLLSLFLMLTPTLCQAVEIPANIMQAVVDYEASPERAVAHESANVALRLRLIANSQTDVWAAVGVFGTGAAKGYLAEKYVQKVRQRMQSR